MELNSKSSSVTSAVDLETTGKKQTSKYRDGIRLVVMSGIAAVAAGVITSAIAKKRARQYLTTQGHELEQLPETGTALALKALCYATVITIGSFSLAIFGVCKWFDIKNMEDLRSKIRKTRRSSPPNPNERTEFESLSDFLNYLNDHYSKSEKEK